MAGEAGEAVAEEDGAGAGAAGTAAADAGVGAAVAGDAAFASISRVSAFAGSPGLSTARR